MADSGGLDEAIVGKQGMNGAGISGSVDPVTGEAGGADAAAVAAAVVENANPVPAGQGAGGLLNQQGQGQSQQPGQGAGGLLSQPGQGQSQQPGQQQPEQAPADPDSMPITDFGKVDLQLGSAQVDADLLADFGGTATEIGLTPRQARALAQWHVKALEEAREKILGAESKVLQTAWGRNMESNSARVNALVSQVDRMPGLGNFSAELARSGATNNAVVCQGLLALAMMLGEDRLGKAAPGAPLAKETAYDGILAAFERAKGKRD